MNESMYLLLKMVMFREVMLVFRGGKFVKLRFDTCHVLQLKELDMVENVLETRDEYK